MHLSHFPRLRALKSAGLSAVLVVLTFGCGEVVSDNRLAPVANAGDDQVVAPGSAVTLDASQSQSGDAPVDGYRWSLVGLPESSQTTLSAGDGVSVSLTPDVLGSYLVSLVVEAGGVRSEPDLVVVTAADVNRTPTVVAACGPGTNCEVLHGQMAELDGRATVDPEGDAFTLEWSQLTDPAQCTQCRTLSPCMPSDAPAVLSNSDQALARFTAPDDKDLTLVFALTATQGSVTVSDCVAYQTTNQAPVVLVDGSSGTVNPAVVSEGTMFTLAATSSFDPDSEDVLEFTWTQTAGAPEAFSGMLSGPSIEVTAPALTDPPGTTPSVQLTFEVIAGDGVDQTRAEITVTVENT
ncbi:MAG: hypothetical protein AAFY60_05555 [Myxococcota bacterium]